MILKFGEKRQKTKYIIIHHFGVYVEYWGNPEIEKKAVLNAYNKYPEYFYHYVILSNGEIVNKHTDDIVVYHANNNDVNNESIAICLFGEFSKQKPSNRQIEVLKALIKKLIEKYNIKPENILGHKDVGEAYTICPGDNLYSLLPQIRKEVFPMTWDKEAFEWCIKKGIIKTPEAHSNLDESIKKKELFAIIKNLYEIIIKEAKNGK